MRFSNFVAFSSSAASSSFHFGGRSPGSSSFSNLNHFNPTSVQNISCSVIDPCLPGSLSESDKKLLTLILGLEDPNDFIYAAEADLSDMVHSGYNRMSKDQRMELSEAAALIKIRKIYANFVKPAKKPIEVISENNNSNGGSVWGSVAITRACKSTERDAGKFPSISGGRWDGFKDSLQRPVKVFVREIGQVGSEQSMTATEIYRYLCSQISPVIKRELSEHLNSKGLLSDTMANPRLNECENWLLSSFQSTNSSTRLMFRLDSMSQAGESIDNYISRFKSVVWESDIVGLHLQPDLVLQKFSMGLDDKYGEYADFCNLLSSDSASQSTASFERLINNLRDWEIRQVAKYGHRPNERGQFKPGRRTSNAVTEINPEKVNINGKINRPCYYFQRSKKCKFGEQCRYRHDLTSQQLAPSSPDLNHPPV
jgi:hypothetical protein